MQFLREPQTVHECRKCGAKIPLDALARFEYTCPGCKKTSYGRTNIEDAGIPEIMPGGLQTIDRAIETYGKDAQLTKAVEEMSELTKALCKYKECQRKYDNPLNRKPQEVYSNIEEEIADVFIMLVQLLAFFRGRESVSITKIVWDKLDRLKDNLDKEAAKQEGCKDDTPEC